MTLNINDTIQYGTDICKVAGKTKKEFNGQHNEYYILKPVHDEKSTIYIPVNSKKAAAKIRRILSIEEIYALIKEMPNANMLWISDDTKRKEEFRQILASGDRGQLVRMIRTLYQKKQEKVNAGKKMRADDERFMKEAERILYEEFAHVLDISLDQVIPFIIDQIEIKEKPVL